MKRAAKIAGVALLVMLTGVVSRAEDEKPEVVGGLSFADEVEVTVVNIDVFVRSKRGEPVRGLTAQDFRLTQDGIAMPITNFAVLEEKVFDTVFAEPELPVEVATPTPERREVAELKELIKPVYMVLYIDNENIHPMQRNRVLRRVREFVTANLREPVQMMVVAYQRSFEVVQPFTSDPVAVNQALRSLQQYTGGRIDRDSERRRLIEDMREAQTQDHGTSRDNRDLLKDRFYREIVSFAREEVNILSFTMTALRQVVNSLSGLDGRKSIVYISNGLPMVPGMGLMHEYAIQWQDNSIMSQRSRFDRSADFRSLVSTANAQDVTLYTIDAEGLQVRLGGDVDQAYSSDPTASSVGASNYQSSLRYMASNTGGLAIVNTNDVAPGLAKIRDDLFSYYSLGYTVGNSGSDRVHQIEVEVPGHDDYELRYRRRFVEKSLETKVQDAVLAALVFDVEDNPMELRVEAGEAAPAANERWAVPIHVSFPLRHVALVPLGEAYEARIVLFVAARDEDGKESGLQRQEHVVRVPAADYEKAAGERFGIDLQLLMTAGRHRVVVGLLDPLTRQDSYQRLAVSNP